MSFDQNKKDKNEYDDLKIKLHLDTSLEMDGISVSEDLINRTLQAIKKSEGVSDEEMQNAEPQASAKKIIPFGRYIRGFAAVAAAALILVAGANAFRLMGNTKDKSNTMESPMYRAESAPDNAAAKKETKADVTKKSAAEADVEQSTAQDTQASGTAGTADTSSQFSAKYSMAADGADSDAETAAGNGTSVNETQSTDAGTASDSSQADTSDNNNQVSITATSRAPMGITALDAQYNLQFSDICLITPENVNSIVVSDSTTGNSVTVTDISAVNDLYKMMGRYSYALGSEASGTNLYTINITAGNSVYVMTVEDNGISADLTSDGNTSNTLYTVSDQKALLSELAGYFNAD